MSFDPLTAITDLVKTGLDKFVRDKMDEKTAEQLKNEMKMFVLEQANDQQSTFRQFIVDYEGAAKDVPKLIIYFRALIRPTFTCLIGYLDFIYFTDALAAWDPERIALLKAINIIVLLFWFGERAVKNSGVLDILLKRKS